MTTKELIEYLQGFPPESYITMIALDTHQERKYAFVVEHLSLITDQDAPQIWVHIDREAARDVTREEDEEPEAEEDTEDVDSEQG